MGAVSTRHAQVGMQQRVIRADLLKAEVVTVAHGLRRINRS